jgi:hypothetical protein
MGIGCGAIIKLLALKQNLRCHKFKDEREEETEAT